MGENILENNFGLLWPNCWKRATTWDKTSYYFNEQIGKYYRPFDEVVPSLNIISE